MNSLHDIYIILKENGICQSQADFSEKWLGRSPGYLAFLKSSGGSCCPVSLLVLGERLSRHANLLRHPEPNISDMPKIIVLRNLEQHVASLTNIYANSLCKDEERDAIRSSADHAAY